MRLPDPANSWLLLVGSSAYEEQGNLPSLPGVSGNLSAMLRALTSPGGAAIPQDHIEVLHDPDEPSLIEEALLELADRRADTLIFYFAGHGLLDEHGDLYLATRKSSTNRPQLRSLPYRSVRRAITSSRASNRIVLLDCCYSGRAISAMSGGEISGGDVEVSGTYTLTSTSANRTAHAPTGESLTAFTRALVDVLEQGEPDGPELIDLITLHRAVTRRLKAAGRPTPMQQGTNTVSGLALAPNRARRRATVAIPLSEAAFDAVAPTRHRTGISGMTVRPAGGRVIGAAFAGDNGLVAAVVPTSASVVAHGADHEQKSRKKLLTATLSASRVLADTAGFYETDSARLAFWEQPDSPRWDSGPIPKPTTSSGPSLAVSPDLRTAFVVSRSGCFECPLGFEEQLTARSRWRGSFLTYSNLLRRALDAQEEPVLVVTYHHLKAALASAANVVVNTRAGRANAPAISGLREFGALDVSDARTGESLERIQLPIAPRSVFALECLPGHLVAITGHSGEEQRPIRSILVDTASCTIVQDHLVSGIAAQRYAVTNAGLPRFRVSSDGGHLASVTSRTGRTVTYTVQGTGVVSNLPGAHVGWSPIAPVLACCAHDEITLFEVDARSEPTTRRLPEPATGDPVFSTDGRRLAVPCGGVVATFSLSL
jgi:hypothetical protein